MSIRWISPSEKSLANELIFFHSWLEDTSDEYKSRSKFFSTYFVGKLDFLKPFAWESLEWYWKKSRDQKQHLLDFLLSLDQAYRVDPEAPRTRRVRDGITHIMENLCKKLQELEPRFTGRLVPMGSSHNGTKIVDCDEFDFAYEMNIETLLSGRATFKSISCTPLTNNSLNLNMSAESSEDLNFFEFPVLAYVYHPRYIAGLPPLTNAWDEDCSGHYRNATRFEGENCVLNIEHVAFSLYQNIYQALADIQLPPGWSHGGFARPNYSGVRVNLPSFMLQFEYLFDDREPPLQLSVDFVPVIKLPIQETDQNDVLNDVLIEGHYMPFSWIRLELRDLRSALYSHAEDELLAEYSWDSIPKTLIRVCKALHSLAKLSLNKYLDEYILSGLKYYTEAVSKEESLVHSHSMISNNLRKSSLTRKMMLDYDTKYATYHDIGESAGQFEHVSSYTFKRTVMTLMALDENKGHMWKEADLPDLVMSVFMAINDLRFLVNDHLGQDDKSPIILIKEISVPFPETFASQLNKGTSCLVPSTITSDEDAVLQESSLNQGACASPNSDNQGAKCESIGEITCASPNSDIQGAKCESVCEIACTSPNSDNQGAKCESVCEIACASPNSDNQGAKCESVCEIAYASPNSDNQGAKCESVDEIAYASPNSDIQGAKGESVDEIACASLNSDNQGAKCESVCEIAPWLSAFGEAQAQSRSFNAIACGDPPKFYPLFQSVIREEKCEKLLSLSYVDKWEKHENFDVGIYQVFQVLQAAFEAKKDASVEIWRQRSYLSDEGCGKLITKEELKNVWPRM